MGLPPKNERFLLWQNVLDAEKKLRTHLSAIAITAEVIAGSAV